MSQQAMRIFSIEFKEATVLRLEAGERIAAVSDELKIKRKLLYEWRAAYRAMGLAGFNRKRGPKPGFLAARASPVAEKGAYGFEISRRRNGLAARDMRPWSSARSLYSAASAAIGA